MLPGEPDRATLTCVPVPDEPGDPPSPPVTDTDDADLECLDASVDVIKECAANNGDGSYTYDVKVTNTGTAPLENCFLTDTNPVPATCSPLSATELTPGQMATAQCRSDSNMNMVEATCNIAGTTKPVSDEAMAGCLDMDKQISCDGGATFVDVGYNDNVNEFCRGGAPPDPNDPAGQDIVVRYLVRTGSAMTQCSITESNSAVSQGPVSIGDLPAKFDDEVFRTQLLTCDEVVPGEPDTATLTCNPVPDEPGDPARPAVTDTDSADLECDRDGDGVPDDRDNCPDTPNPDQGDRDGDEIGNLCEPLDHFLSYRIKRSRGESKFEKLRLLLEDQFGRGTFEVSKELELLNPANKNQEGINDRETHLKAYQVKISDGDDDDDDDDDSDSDRRTALPDVQVSNQFGQIVLEVKAADRLLVPASKSHSQLLPQPDPNAMNLDHFLCYTVKLRGTPTDLLVRVEDQFGPARSFRVRGPKFLCNPVDKRGEGIKNPEDHLVCYSARPAPHEPKQDRIKGLFVNDQFGPSRLDTKQERELCVPSRKEILD